MFKKLVTETGEEHGMINQVGNSVPDNDFKHMKPETKIKATAEKKEDSKVVKARYINHRGPNERLDKPYCRWAGEPIQFWHLIPGQVYDLPYGLIKEVNDPNVRLKKRSEILDSKGVATVKEGAAEIIHELVPISF